MIPKTYCIRCALRKTELKDISKVYARWDVDEFENFIKELRKMIKIIKQIKSGKIEESVQLKEKDEHGYFEECVNLSKWKSVIPVPKEVIRIESHKKKFFKKEQREIRS